MTTLILALTMSCFLSSVFTAPVDKKSHDKDELPEFICSRTYKYLGCRVENQVRTTLVNFRDSFNWKHSPESIHRIACICNSRAQKEGFPYFSLSFYGLCNGFMNVSMEKKSDKCVNGNLEKCSNDDNECDGGSLNEAVYKTGKLSEEKYIDHDKDYAVKIPDAKTFACDAGYRFRMLACQKEDFARIILFNDRDTIDWYNFPAWLKGMVCKCRAYAKANKFEYFSVAFWGICGGLDKHGHKQTTALSNCKRTLSPSAKNSTCDMSQEDKPCAGIGYADVVYDTNTHPCDTKSKGGCKQVCVRNADSYYCDCHKGYEYKDEVCVKKPMAPMAA